jgi:hypothetical protein
MTLPDKIRKAMNELTPEDGPLVDGPIRYHSTRLTHDSYKQQLNHARPDSSVEYWYLLRCYDWIRLLKKNNIKLHNAIK